MFKIKGSSVLGSQNDALPKCAPLLIGHPVDALPLRDIRYKNNTIFGPK
jgi:hypothetical protein